MIKEFIYAIEWRHRLSPDWKFWSMRWTESAARRWIERESAKHSKCDFRVARYVREDY